LTKEESVCTWVCSHTLWAIGPSVNGLPPQVPLTMRHPQLLTPTCAAQKDTLAHFCLG